MQQRHLISLTIMLATFGALAQDRPAAIYDFEVPGSTKWLDTKIDVKAGEVLKFTGGGTIRYAAQLQEIGPAGHVGELFIRPWRRALMPKNSDDDADFVAGGVFWATLLAIGLSVGGLGWVVGGGIACVMALVTWVWVGTMTESRERNQAMLRKIKEEPTTAGGSETGRNVRCGPERSARRVPRLSVRSCFTIVHDLPAVRLQIFHLRSGRCSNGGGM